jgi:D-serine deaminase-like pyridoxal phosphate-dependent protein
MGYPHLHFAGLMTYPAVGKQTETGAWLAEAVALLAADGIACPVVSSGGSPDLWSAHNVGGVTEYRPGTYIYLDRYQVTKGVGSFDDCALTVAATVVSRPTFERAVIDAGSKALTSDTLGLPGYGYIPEYPEAAIVALSEEHGTIDVSRCARKPPVGERITIIPNHACVVSNQFDEVYLASGGKVVETVPVAARGKLG